MNSKTAIIIPAYNEAKNIAILLEKIKKVGKSTVVIIVDDSSAVENILLKQRVKKKAILLSRYKKLGRGSAVLLGFTQAIKDENIEYFFEMDADLTHDPKECQKFISKMQESKYDVVIGSRYRKGSKFIYLPKHRTFISRIINTFLYILLGVRVTDYTSGFRLYNRKAVRFLIKQPLIASGFILLSETIYRLQRNKFSIGEVSIIVYKRKFGTSTLTLGEFFRSFFVLLRLRFLEK